jgi:dihydroxyacetone kinase
MGVASVAHALPGAAERAREIQRGQIELGLGIHGEPGARVAPAARADEARSIHWFPYDRVRVVNAVS